VFKGSKRVCEFVDKVGANPGPGDYLAEKAKELLMNTKL
jgi:hypothetical protein